MAATNSDLDVERVQSSTHICNRLGLVCTPFRTSDLALEIVEGYLIIGRKFLKKTSSIGDGTALTTPCQNRARKDGTASDIPASLKIDRL